MSQYEKVASSTHCPCSDCTAIRKACVYFIVGLNIAAVLMVVAGGFTLLWHFVRWVMS